MEILICSDSHGNQDNLIRLVKDHPEATHLLFCGDGVKDLAILDEVAPHLIVMAVCGNCDGFSFSSDTPYERDFSLCGIRILMMHGHTHGVKWELESALRYAADRGADILLFGHTHWPCHKSEEMNGRRVHLFNPVSIGKREFFGYSYGLLTIRENGFLLSHGRYR
jgi:putative phosphoesterase